MENRQNLPHQGMDRSKTGQTGRGLRREANKGKTTSGGDGCEAAKDKHGGHNIEGFGC